ncbi:MULTISPECIES: DUF2510 domain-containing protein [unclassified Microbacterium]|uniref:DUF2510 domain-containing protein n=1 Tax=unclassified Microbacterium TaxID=2609290 RepID=UPI00214BC51A|nr:MULTISPECIES: DUF2510 domain-containing protein [unclassified Microbacterium]MCR2783785.1 DUF2510 domain-containing protein [Microbacterium sp. zg.B96]MDL5351423.1 DUF2510 domain-containing protein [Microbacterium sp. zg-YB36]WIM15363.1 DUF2510 domain-containing protein [Microbacterium sp. zg-B96]
MSTTPPGWYDDGSGTQRWWDGSAWTEHVQPQAPAGYPGYAGQTPQSSPSSPGAPAQKSKLWIVFVVLGVVVIGLIVLAAVFIPRIISALVPTEGAAGGDAERAAIVTVERYDEAWNEADCALYFASTTEDYRTAVGMTDCAAFEAEAEIFGESTDEYEIAVDSVEREDDVITVMTTETFLSLIDENDQPLATPEAVSTPYEYTLVPAGDGWAIDDVW